MESKDHQILSHLRDNARVSLKIISQRLGMPVSTVHDKVSKLQKSCVIKKHTTLVDFARLGYHHHNKIVLKVNTAQKKDFLAFLQSQNCVNALYEINSGFDFMIEVVHKDVKEYTIFMEWLQEGFEVIELHEYRVTGVIEKEKFL